MASRLLVLNAALNGAHGNTAALLSLAAKQLQRDVLVEQVVLAEDASYPTARAALERSDGLLIGSGTHWDSWSHLLQRFLEEATPDEGSDLFLGKPAGVVVTMHSVGGKGVLSRLQGVLNTFGCVIPPMSGMVYSLVNQSAAAGAGSQRADLWTPDDVTVITQPVGCARVPGQIPQLARRSARLRGQVVREPTSVIDLPVRRSEGLRRRFEPSGWGQTPLRGGRANRDIDGLSTARSAGFVIVS